ncbi:hypothetical protein [Kitasatospora sp. NPDC093806]|uniref:hypothetical protein n=1 Tax=Kitasatospora sp. NPDC093806 TaxID=3155075 RepID=UPI00343F226C
MRGAGEREAVRAVVRWAGHPGTLGAVAVLLFNDHVAKRAWPGPVTGKLSDLAWMLVSPVVLALLLTPLLRLRGDRPAIAGLAATAMMFAVAKSGPWGGELASTIWSLSGVTSRIRGDRSDLVALPALGISWWLWTRSRAAERRPRRWTAAVAVPLAVAAMVATSTSGPQQPVLWRAGNQPVLDTADGHRWTTRDGGTTWAPLGDRQDLPGESEGRGRPQDGRCAADEPQRCFRLLDATSPIEASDDGGRTWHTAFDPGPPWRRLPYPTPTPNPSASAPAPPASDPPSPSRPPTEAGQSRPAELIIVPAPQEGWVVLADYPSFGLVRGTPGGTWSLQRYPTRRTAVVPEKPRSWLLGLPVALAVGFAGALAADAARLLRTAAPARRRRELLLLLLRQGLCLAWVRLAAWLCGGKLLWLLPGVVPASLLTVGLLPMLWSLRHRPAPAGRRLLLALSVFGTAYAATALLPYLRWAAGALAAWSQASDQAFLTALAATAVAPVVAALTTPPPTRPHPPGPPNSPSPQTPAASPASRDAGPSAPRA